ncbi:hypothetical protein FRB99_008748 [Tulasnella sp. 403]|nr:hypothetical protein FRB99_008748 [Tulasnella sp. 403]
MSSNTAVDTTRTGASYINSPTTMSPPDRTTSRPGVPPIDTQNLKPPSHRSKRRLSYWQELLRPKRPVGEAPTMAGSLRAIVFASWLNILLVFIPVSNGADLGIAYAITAAFLAIIPLAKLLGFATEELSLRVGETLGGLLNATLGNAVELIISIIALTKCQLRVVQASLVGSILSNLLLVLGMCFFAGGVKFSEQTFMVTAAQLNSSLLTLSVVALIIPATFHAALTNNPNTDEGPFSTTQEGNAILKMSRGVSVILLFIYACNLVYTLWSHAHLYDQKQAPPGPQSVAYPASLHTPIQHLGHLLGHGEKSKSKGSVTAAPPDQHVHVVPPPAEGKGALPGTESVDGHLQPPPSEIHSEEAHAETKGPVEEEEETPQISVLAATILLVVVTVLVAFTAEFLVDSINGLVESSPLSQEWVGLILLPIVGNAAEHVTAVTVSVKDKLDLSIVITVNYVVADGRSNWLEGMILMCLYVLIAVALWFYPGSDPAATLLQCR